MDVGLSGEEQVLPSWVVPLVGRRTHDADAAGQYFVGNLGASEQRALVAAYEEHHRPGAQRLVARVLQAPTTEKGVVGEQLLAVVRGPFGQVELDKQIE